MIVPSMSHKEICDALFSDLPKLKIRTNTLIPKMAKQFKKRESSRDKLLAVFGLREVPARECELNGFSSTRRA